MTGRQDHYPLGLGYCLWCPEKAAPNRALCERHLDAARHYARTPAQRLAARLRARKRTKSKPWKPGGKGAAAIAARPATARISLTSSASSSKHRQGEDGTR